MGEGLPDLRRGARRRAAGTATILLAGCTPAPPPDGDIHVRFDITGRINRPGVTLVHAADARHGCIQPQRVRLPTATTPAPAAHEPPNIVFGYTVHFGPDYHPEGASLAPEWRGYGPQTGFTLEVFASPGALEATGPVQLGRPFRVTVGTREGLWQRTIDEGDPPSAGSFAIAPDGLSGRFRATGLVLQLPHNEMPDSESISVGGIWRCPAP
jgi:hypothetical protein